VRSGDTLTKESVAEAARYKQSSSHNILCNTAFDNLITCVVAGERTVIFHPQTNRGGISSLFGSTMLDSANRDTVSVQTFTCQSY